MKTTIEMESILEKVTAELRADPETVGVIVHGSYVKGTLHADSDIDILCLTEADWISMEIRKIDGVPVEIHCTPLNRAVESLKRYNVTNDNFYLLTFTEGRILFERDDLISQVCRDAEAMIESGPEPINPLEIYIGRTFMKKRLSEVRRLVQADPTSGMARVLADALLQKVVFAYCKSHRRWAGNFKEILPALMKEDGEFGAHCQSFLDAQTGEELLSSIEKVVNCAMAPVGEGAENPQTGRIPVSSLPF